MKLRSGIVLPLVLAVSAHALSWAFTAFWLAELQDGYGGSSDSDEIARLIVMSPVVLTAIVAICVPFANRDVVVAITGLLFVMCFLGMLTIGWFLLPIAVLVLLVAVKMES